ncbi:MAG: hypothetical protein ACK5ZN_01460 [Phycisphaerales bacterium]
MNRTTRRRVNQVLVGVNVALLLAVSFAVGRGMSVGHDAAGAAGGAGGAGRAGALTGAMDLAGLRGLPGLEGVALAQPAGPPVPQTRPRGEYLMLSGRAQAAASNYLYVLDRVNQELIGLKYNQSQQRYDVFAYRNLADDARSTAGGRTR